MAADKNSTKVLQPNDDIESDIFDWNDYKISFFIQKNLTKSNDNEDCLFYNLADSGAVLGVADGVGGHPRGKDASRIAAECVVESYADGVFDGKVVLDIIEKANAKVRDLKVGARTTLVLGVINKDELRAYSIGDSEILYCNNRGNVIFSNIPQSPVGYAIAGGHMEQESSLDEPDRHLVNHLVGDEVLRLEASSKIALKKGHTILIGSDGLFDNIHHDKLIEYVTGGVFEECHEKLKSFCCKKPEDVSWRKDDDISYILIRRVRS